MAYWQGTAFFGFYDFFDLFFLMESPSRSIVKALCTRRSRRASPTVGPPIDSGQSLKQASETAVGLGQVEGAEEFGSVEIEGAKALPAGFVRQGAGQIRFAHAGEAGDDAVAMMADPFAGGQLLDHGAL